MILDRRIATGNPPSPSPGVDMAYILWLASVIGATLAGLCLMVNLCVYTFNGIAEFSEWPSIFPGTDHARLLMVTGLFAMLSGMAHFARLRTESLARAIIPVHFPGDVVAQTIGGDSVTNKFRCRARIRIDVYEPGMAEKIELNRATLRDALEKGLAIAITDPITRFSKAKIEETLKLSLGERLNLLDVAGVTLTKLRQERVAEQLVAPAEDTEATENSAEATSSP